MLGSNHAKRATFQWGGCWSPLDTRFDRELVGAGGRSLQAPGEAHSVTWDKDNRFLILLLSVGKFLGCDNCWKLELDRFLSRSRLDNDSRFPMCSLIFVQQILEQGQMSYQLRMAIRLLLPLFIYPFLEWYMSGATGGKRWVESRVHLWFHLGAWKLPLSLSFVWSSQATTSDGERRHVSWFLLFCYLPWLNQWETSHTIYHVFAI